MQVRILAPSQKPMPLPPESYLIIALIFAYLTGSIPFAVVSSRVFGLADPRSYGSGNPGATNVLRSGHKGAALLTLLGDAAKGWLAVWLAGHFAGELGFGPLQLALVGLFAFLGHLFPVFLGFKGGKGVATAAGVLFALNPWLGLAVLGTWIATAVVFRYSSLAALTAALSAPGFMWLIEGRLDFATGVIALMSAALIAKHHVNIRRLLAGEESRLGSKKKTPE